MGEQTFVSGTAVPTSSGQMTERAGRRLVFGGVMVILAGLFTVIMGLVALTAGEHYVVGPEGTLVVDLTVWGWVHLAVGAFALGTGVALALGAAWARVIAVLLVGFNAVSHLAFLRHRPRPARHLGGGGPCRPQRPANGAGAPLAEEFQ